MKSKVCTSILSLMISFHMKKKDFSLNVYLFCITEVGWGTGKQKSKSDQLQSSTLTAVLSVAECHLSRLKL